MSTTQSTDGSTALKIAVPNKGSLSEAATRMLREAGYRQRSDTKELVCVDPRHQAEFYYLRPTDIAVYVGEGALDVGITGRDILLDSRAPATEPLPLGFGSSKLRFAAAADAGLDVAGLDGKRIATSYPGLVESYLAERGVSARLITLDGAVESAIRLGLADAIADVVETGVTLRQNGLAVFGEPLLQSEAVLVHRTDAPTPAGLDLLVRRISGVLVARDYVMMDYDVAGDRVERACALTPGLESPTVSSLSREGWFAVRAMVPRDDAQQIMDGLWDLGARAILVTDISACRI